MAGSTSFVTTRLAHVSLTGLGLFVGPTLVPERIKFGHKHTNWKKSISRTDFHLKTAPARAGVSHGTLLRHGVSIPRSQLLEVNPPLL